MAKLSSLRKGSLVIPKVGQYKDKYIIVLDSDGVAPNVTSIVGVCPDGHRVVHSIKELRYPTEKELAVYDFVGEIFGYGATLVDLNTSRHDGLFVPDFNLNRDKRTIDKTYIGLLFNGGMLYSGEYFSFTGEKVDGLKYHLKIKAIAHYKTYRSLNKE